MADRALLGALPEKNVIVFHNYTPFSYASQEKARKGSLPPCVLSFLQ